MTNFAVASPFPTLRHRPPGARRAAARALGVVLALCTAMALALLGAAPASAHAQLVETDPADGERLDQAPASVELTFNEHIEQIGSQVVITDAGGTEVQDGDPQIDGPTLTQDLIDERPEGSYTVQWRVVSADGHPVSGEFTFEAAAAAGAQADGADASADDEGTDGAADDAAEDDATAGGEAAEDSADQAPAEEPADAAPVAGEAQGSFPWGLLFALAGVGVVLALVVRARRQLRDQAAARPPAQAPDQGPDRDQGPAGGQRPGTDPDPDVDGEHRGDGDPRP